MFFRIENDAKIQFKFCVIRLHLLYNLPRLLRTNSETVLLNCVYLVSPTLYQVLIWQPNRTDGCIRHLITLRSTRVILPLVIRCLPKLFASSSIQSNMVWKEPCSSLGGVRRSHDNRMDYNAWRMEVGITFYEMVHIDTRIFKINAPFVIYDWKIHC